ncbi:hypothetical protein BV898_03274 [Hypsibius exemplaris]|uniref:Uncharacterized protein n=1 Tax=Hypsibius exemplaris TaxID=2072580 RepID=A0A1W0X697_HYPEX|nr:hypothetical protein BV898_03274 [Hypsibius exemplaris]
MTMYREPSLGVSSWRATGETNQGSGLLLRASPLPELPDWREANSRAETQRFHPVDHRRPLGSLRDHRLLKSKTATGEESCVSETALGTFFVGQWDQLEPFLPQLKVFREEVSETVTYGDAKNLAKSYRSAHSPL